MYILDSDNCITYLKSQSLTWLFFCQKDINMYYVGPILKNIWVKSNNKGTSYNSENVNQK